MVEVTVILPAYNEEEAIGRVIDEIKSTGLDCQILVVDNNSTDRTSEIALDKGAAVIREPKQGKGHAVRTGIFYAATPYTIVANADYTYPMGYTVIIHHLLKVSNADVVMGYRHIKEKDSMTLINSLGNWVLSLMASILYGRRVYDVCTGLWGFRTEVLQGFKLSSLAFTLEAELFINSIRGGYRIEQIPIAYRARLEGSTPKLKIGDGFRIGWFLIKQRLIYRRR